MNAAALVVLAAEEHIDLGMPTWVFGVIALVLFAAALFVVLSFRDVANRHSDRVAADAAAEGGSTAGES